MLLRMLSLAPFLLLPFGCGRSPSAAPGVSEAKNVFGKDNRIAVTNGAYPWSTIGRFTTGEGSCTGTLVGPALVLTAAHCVIDSYSGELSATIGRFYPHMVDGKSKTSAVISRVWWGTTEPEEEHASDWALMQLSTRLGDTTGWMGGSNLAAKDYDSLAVELAGYSADVAGGETATVDQACTVHEEKDGLLLNDCDMTRGASGGPIFRMVGGYPMIVGINVAEHRRGGEDSLKVEEYSEPYSNAGVPTATFIAKLQELRQL